MNGDLFKNPFDIECKEWVVAFAKLLLGIVATVDRYGLKKRYLHKHERELENFRCRFLERNPRVNFRKGTGDVCKSIGKNVGHFWGTMGCRGIITMRRQP